MRAPDGAVAVAEEHRERILRYFRGRCPDPEDAEDLAQEAFCAILEAYGRFRGRSSPSTWVYAICRNVYGNWVYDGMRRRRTGDALRLLHDEEAPEDPAELRVLLEGLSRAERELYELYYAQDLPIRAVAARLGRPEGTVKYLLYRLRGRIREMLT